MESQRKYGRAIVWDKDRTQCVNVEQLTNDPTTSELARVDLTARPEDAPSVLLSVRALIHSIEIDFCKRQGSPGVKVPLTKAKSEPLCTPQSHERTDRREQLGHPFSSGGKIRERERTSARVLDGGTERDGIVATTTAFSGSHARGDSSSHGTLRDGRVVAHDSNATRYVSSRSMTTTAAAATGDDDDATECEALLAHVVGKKRKLVSSSSSALESDSSSALDGSRSSSANSSPWMSPELNHYTPSSISKVDRNNATSGSEPIRKRQSLHELAELLDDEPSSIDKLTAQMQLGHENKLKLEREKLAFQRLVMQERLRIAEAKLQLRREEADERRREREQRIKERELELQVEQTKLAQLRLQLELQRHGDRGQQHQQSQASNT